MNYFQLFLLLLIFSCNKNEKKPVESIHSYVDNDITGNPLSVEIYKEDKPSIKINSDNLHQYDGGNTLLFGGVYADLFNNDGEKTSEMYSDSAIIFNRSDSVKAIGDVIVESLKGFKLHTTEIILYNDVKLVKSDSHIMFTSQDGDTLYGKGFWSNFDMSNSQFH